MVKSAIFHRYATWHPLNLDFSVFNALGAFVGLAHPLRNAFDCFCIFAFNIVYAHIKNCNLKIS